MSNLNDFLCMGEVNQTTLKQKCNYLVRYYLHTHTVWVSGHTPSPHPSFIHSLVILCFKQTTTVKKAAKMRMRITMATAANTPMMTVVSTLPGPGGGGG